MSMETDCRSKNLLEAIIPVGKDFVLRGRKSEFISLKAHGPMTGPYPKFIYNFLFVNPALQVFDQGPIQVSEEGRCFVRLVNKGLKPIKITHGNIVGSYLSRKETGAKTFVPPPLMSIQLHPYKPVHITDDLQG